MFREKIDVSKGLDKIEGIVTLELKDAKTGNLEQKVTTNNFIAPPAITRHQWEQRNNFKNGIYALQNNKDADYEPSSVFDTLFLSDSTKDETDPTGEFHVPGRIIGYSTKATYSGVSTFRGSPNGTNSEATSTYTKWVFDWPAIAANGTIASVGWMGGSNHDYYDTYSPVTGTATALQNQSTPSQWQAFTRKDSNATFAVAAVYNTLEMGTTVAELNASYQQGSSFSVGGDFSSLRGIAWDNGNSRLWVLGKSGTDFFIAAYDSSGTNTIAKIGITQREYKTLAFDGTNLWSTVQNGETTTVYQLNVTDGTDIGNFSFDLTNVGNYTEVLSGAAWNATRSELWFRTNSRDASGYSVYGRFLSFDTSGNPTSSSTRTDIWYPANTGTRRNLFTGRIYYYSDFDFIDASTLAVSADTSTNSNVHEVVDVGLDSLGSRALLPAPITKNNTQTLTITYQINYPYPGAY